MPDKAIDLVDEACAALRVQINGQPKDIEELEAKRKHLEVEFQALGQEDDRASKARLSEVIPSGTFFCPCNSL